MRRISPQLVVLIIVVVGIYLPRLTTLTIRGEESRRAQVAVEILRTGDWIVPRQQGQIYTSRPPLGSWPIAALGWLRGDVDLVAVRLPTITAVLLTSLLIYGYTRKFLSANGALASGLAFATMAQALQIGRLAETEATFTLLVSSSLLVWHWGYSRGWSRTVMWCVGYALAALAGLAKGPQGPVYFVTVTWIYLAVQRDWQTLFSRSHLAGLFTFAVVLGSWQIPYYLATDLHSSIQIWTNNAAKRFEENDQAATLLTHLLLYPLEVLACLLPWSLLLLRYADRRLLATLGGARPYVMFSAVAITVTFPSVWFASTAKGRYFMPLYPCFAVLIGVVLDRALNAEVGSHLRKVWREYAALVSIVLVGFGLFAVGSTWLPMRGFHVSLMVSSAFLLMAAIGCAIVLSTANRRPAIGLVSVACVTGAAYVSVMLSAAEAVSHDAQAEVAKLKQQLPTGEELVSFDRIDHLFAYLYETPIGFRNLPTDTNHGPLDYTYFCVNEEWFAKRELPFAWEPVASVALDRNRREVMSRHVLVGRRLDGDVRRVGAKPQALGLPRAAR